MKTERMMILVTPEQKKAINAKAKALQLSAGELIRRAVDTYTGDTDTALLNAIADELEAATARLSKSFDRTFAEIAKTKRYFAARRKGARG
jgi:hypothetical protein